MLHCCHVGVYFDGCFTKYKADRYTQLVSIFFDTLLVQQDPHAIASTQPTRYCGPGAKRPARMFCVSPAGTCPSAAVLFTLLTHARSLE